MFDAGYMEHLNSQPDSIADLDRADAYQVGEFHPNRCWVVSDRDAVYRNPFYKGPTTLHPEDDPSNFDRLFVVEVRIADGWKVLTGLVPSFREATTYAREVARADRRPTRVVTIRS